MQQYSIAIRFAVLEYRNTVNKSEIHVKMNLSFETFPYVFCQKTTSTTHKFVSNLAGIHGKLFLNTVLNCLIMHFS